MALIRDWSKSVGRGWVEGKGGGGGGKLAAAFENVVAKKTHDSPHQYGTKLSNSP